MLVNPQFTEQRGPGIPLVVYSVLLTRGIDGDDGVLSDMDQGFGACSMIGRHNYATQELVNLLLYGRAHSNVFDGTHSLPGEKPGESIVLRGTPFQGDSSTCDVSRPPGFVHVQSGWYG